MIINVDGGARGNPGESGIGIVLTDSKEKTGYYYYTGHSTNNEAEYKALVKGLQLALSKKKDYIEIFTDSQLISNQINGKYKVKNQNLKKYYDEAVLLINNFKSFAINHIPREKNKEADRLANIAMDSKSNGEVELAVAPPFEGS